MKALVKAKLKSALGEMTRKLPWGGRRAILDTLVEDFGRFEVFRDLGMQLRVKDVSISGANGVVWGSINDIVVLGRYAESGSWSAQTVGLFQEFFHQRGGGTYLDIGANIGLTLIPIARDRQVQCFGFEPEPRNFSFLKSNIEANCQNGNVDVRQLALFDRKSELQFELSPINPGDHRIRVSTEDGTFEESTRETISVQADRLDNLLQLDSVKLPLAVKMDTQGAEPAIFAGGPNILSAAELLTLEFWPYGLRRIGGDVNAELQFLAEHFTEGSVLPGDKSAEIEWHPIGNVVAELKTHWENPNIGKSYFDVLVRK
jgi:FkbM family methyltransferase